MFSVDETPGAELSTVLGRFQVPFIDSAFELIPVNITCRKLDTLYKDQQNY